MNPWRDGSGNTILVDTMLHYHDKNHTIYDRTKQTKV